MTKHEPIHADSRAESDDIGIVYHAACGDYHWRCYLCQPARRGPHIPSMSDARRSFAAHALSAHGELPRMVPE